MGTPEGKKAPPAMRLSVLVTAATVAALLLAASLTQTLTTQRGMSFSGYSVQTLGQGCGGNCQAALGRSGLTTWQEPDPPAAATNPAPAQQGASPAAPPQAAGATAAAAATAAGATAAAAGTAAATGSGKALAPVPAPAQPQGAGAAEPQQLSIEVLTMNRHYWGQQEGFRGVPTPCDFRGQPLLCRWGDEHNITMERADALWFHCPNPAMYDFDSPPFPDKALIAGCRESDINIPSLADKDFMSRFAYTMLYRLDPPPPLGNNIALPYVPWDIRREKKPPVFEERKGAVIYINSNCRAKNGRDQLVEELATKHAVPLDAMGKCLHNMDEPYGPGKTTIMKGYRVCIAMENSNTRDYVTEKIWQALESGAVPVYVGAPNAKSDFLPSNDSVIWTEDFANVADLAAEINQVLTNKTAWEKYTAWRSRPWEQLNPKYRELVERPDFAAGYNLITNFPFGRCEMCKVLAERKLAKQLAAEGH